MGWETRGRKRYYYRKVRGADGRVRSIYCGTGEPAKATDEDDQDTKGTMVADIQEERGKVDPRALEAARKLEAILNRKNRSKRRRIIL